MKYLLLLIILLSSCSVQKRCERHLAKAQQMGCLKMTNDTIIKLDTIKGFRIDTFVQFHNEIDTLLIDSGGVKSITIIKWKEKIVTQSFYKKDTIIKNRFVNKTIETIKEVYKVKWWHIAIFVAMGVAILFLVIRR